MRRRTSRITCIVQLPAAYPILVSGPAPSSKRNREYRRGGTQTQWGRKEFGRTASVDDEWRVARGAGFGENVVESWEEGRTGWDTVRRG